MEGVFPVARLTRRQILGERAAKVAARVAAFEDVEPQAEGVVPLNPGFFKLERLRTAATMKTREENEQDVPEGTANE